MGSENIVTEIIGGNIRLIRFNKLRKKNAFDIDMYKKVSSILSEASRDDKIRIVVLTGTGNFYSSGNDLTAYKNYAADEYDLQPVLLKFIRSFIEFPKILVAIVNGPAIGIAATTLPLCDLVYASENSYFNTPFTKLGIVAEGCSTFTFPRIMGERKALEMLMFNYKMPAKEALQCGFVNDIYKEEELQHKVWNKMKEIADIKYEALLATKRLIRGQVRDKLIEINELELKTVYSLQNRSKL